MQVRKEYLHASEGYGKALRDLTTEGVKGDLTSGDGKGSIDRLALVLPELGFLEDVSIL